MTTYMIYAWKYWIMKVGRKGHLNRSCHESDPITCQRAGGVLFFQNFSVDNAQPEVYLSAPIWLMHMKATDSSI